LLDNFIFKINIFLGLSMLTEIDNKEPVIKQTCKLLNNRTPVDMKKINIEEDLIFNKMPFMDSFMCKICLGLPFNPIKWNQGHDLICSNCLEEFKKRTNKCPHCNKTPFEAGIIDKLNRNTLNQIEIRCPFLCGEKISIEKLEKHFNDCKILNKGYSCDLCSQKVENASITYHAVLCPKIKMECPYCNIIYDKSEIDTHISKCLKKMKKCNLCRCLIPEKLINSHKDHFCDLLSNIRKGILEYTQSIKNINNWIAIWIHFIRKNFMRRKK